MHACTYMRPFAYEIIVHLLSLIYIDMSIPSYDINKKMSQSCYENFSIKSVLHDIQLSSKWYSGFDKLGSSN